MNARKSLVKFFGPVLLLTASLALPADTMAAPGHGKQAQAAHAKAENHKKQNKKQHANNANKQQRQQQARTSRQRQVRQDRQRAQQRQRHQQVARQKAVKQKAFKQKAARPVVVQQSRVRTQPQLQAQRQVQLQRQNQIRLQQQRQLTLQRQAELRRQTQVRQRNTFRNRYHAAVPYRSGGRRGGGGADPNIFAIDGYLSDEGQECLTLRGHDGRLWSLAGGTYGLQPGEHVRLYGRIVDGGACGWQGTAYDIHEVQTVWADDRHRTTYYDHLYDGPFDQLGQSGDSYNGQYDDGYYDPYNNGGVDIPYRHNGN